MKKTTRFKKLVLDEEILVLPGAYDALSAKIVAQAGFRAVTFGGYGASGSLLAKPDVSLLTMTEMVQQARYIADRDKPTQLITSRR
jgi:2-methylisocitrate lyase-like PEP mutase family enzyme